MCAACAGEVGRQVGRRVGLGREGRVVAAAAPRPDAARRCAGRSAGRRRGRARAARPATAALSSGMWRTCSSTRSRWSRVNCQPSPWLETNSNAAASAVGVPSAADMLDRAQQPRRVGEAGDVGEEAAELELGVQAGLEPAVDLEQDAFVDHEQAVALLGADPADRRVRRRSPARPVRARAAAQHEVAGRDARPRRASGAGACARIRRRGWRRRAPPPAARGGRGPACRAGAARPAARFSSPQATANGRKKHCALAPSGSTASSARR